MNSKLEIQAYSGDDIVAWAEWIHFALQPDSCIIVSALEVELADAIMRVKKEFDEDQKDQEFYATEYKYDELQDREDERDFYNYDTGD